MKILITGASGLVGSEIVLKAEKSLSGGKQATSCEKLRISQIHRVTMSPHENCIPADLTTEEGIKVVESLDFDVIVHSAAWRDPERCLKNQEGALKLNYESTQKIAKIAAARKARMIYMSTDYVFSGINPPYAEDAEPSPVNHYGRTKLLGEQAVMETTANFAILRIPLQYGLAVRIEQCPMLLTTLKALKSEKKWPMDDHIVRYPTYSGDVADAVMLILAKSLRGIYHFTGQDKTTKYGMTLTIGKALGMKTDHIVPFQDPPAGEEARPRDSHLSIGKILKEGLPLPLPFEERIRRLSNLILR